MTSSTPNPPSLPPALPWGAAPAQPEQPVLRIPEAGETIEVLWELEQDDEDIMRVWWPAEVLGDTETTSPTTTRTIRYEAGEGFPPEQVTVRFRDANVLVDENDNELDWRYEGCVSSPSSPRTRAEEAREAAAQLTAQMTEAGLDAVQQAAMAERLREFVCRLTGDASKLAVDGEVSAEHVLAAAKEMVAGEERVNKRFKRFVEGEEAAGGEQGGS